jgi:hypothetical protein
VRCSRPVANAEVERIVASDRTVEPESRRRPRYQPESRRLSPICRNASRPASGLTPDDSQSSIAGSTCRWTTAARLTPDDRAWMCPSAAFVSR